MAEAELKLARAPIVEAVLDIDCDLPPALELTSLEKSSRDLFQPHYPTMQTRYFLEHELEAVVHGASKSSTRSGIRGYMFFAEGRKQLIQVRSQGFSFNRLAPYSSLDHYLPEIQRTWRMYADLTEPEQIRTIRLRYINRINLPAEGQQIELTEYLRVYPRVPDEIGLVLGSFLDQYVAVEKESGHEVRATVTTQESEQGNLPVILDITATCAEPLDPQHWDAINSRIHSLRVLKNRVFKGTLTPRCLQLFY